VRIDILILAVAIVNGAEKIVTCDPHFRRLAQGRIEVIDVPEEVEPGTLFE
jgi:hypothetical protein